MLFYPTPAEGLTWLLASDESWARRAVAAYAAALERDDGDDPDGDGTS